MASSSSDFEEWLCGVLEAAGADGEVYGGYISGSLATMEGATREEIHENVEEILSGCVEDEESCKRLCHQVTEEWMQREMERLSKAREEGEKTRELTVHLPVTSDGVRASQSAREKQKGGHHLGVLSPTEKKKLVAQYGDLSNDEDDDVDDIADDAGGNRASSSHQPPSLQDVFQNVNTQLVIQAEREKKEKEKLAHEVKIDRDRRNREAQKQKVLDRKEKEKKRTQKHERRR